MNHSICNPEEDIIPYNNITFLSYEDFYLYTESANSVMKILDHFMIESLERRFYSKDLRSLYSSLVEYLNILSNYKETPFFHHCQDLIDQVDEVISSIGDSGNDDASFPVSEYLIDEIDEQRLHFHSLPSIYVEVKTKSGVSSDLIFINGDGSYRPVSFNLDSSSLRYLTSTLNLDHYRERNSLVC